MKKPLILIMLLAFYLCKAQTGNFTKQFIADSNYFREKVVTYDFVKKLCLVDNRDLHGLSVKKVLTFLGPPTYTDGYNKSTHLNYFISRKGKHKAYLEIYFEKKYVTSIFERFDTGVVISSSESYDYGTYALESKFISTEIPKKLKITLLPPKVVARIKNKDTIKIPYENDSTLFLPDSNISLFNYIKRNFNCPDSERNEIVVQSVLLSFILDKDDRINNVKIVFATKGPPSIGHEALRLISSIPKLKSFQYKVSSNKLLYNILIRLENS